MKKRLFALLIVFVLLIMPAIAARADVIDEPREDTFYFKHRDELVYIQRYFIVNSPGGSLPVIAEPGSKENLAVLNNDEEIYIEYAYQYRGAFWGYTRFWDSETRKEWIEGWAPMEQLLVIYDHVSFAEEHGSELHGYTGNYDWIRTIDEIVLWTWPGSGVVKETLGREHFDRYGSFMQAYTDPQGREWGFVEYWYGVKNVWICVSDPSNRDIPAFNPASPPAPWQPGDLLPSQISVSVDIWLVIILVAIVAAVTIILIRVFLKPKKAGRQLK